MKRKSKIVLGVLSILIASTLVVSAGLLSYYGKVETTANVQQSVVIDGHNWDEPITHELDINAGCTEVFKHKILNRACVDASIDITTTIDGHGNGPEGVDVQYCLLPGWDYLHLENKDASWDPIDDDYYADFWWNPCCPEFTWEIEGVFKPEADYVLIYYADQPDRFTNWGGAPALKIADITTDSDGYFSAGNSVELDSCIPYDYDWNIGPVADYVASDGYLHGKGAKIWLIPAEFYDGDDNVMTGWDQSEILFETDLIAYFDCNINPIPEYLWSYLEYECPYSLGFPYILSPGEDLCLFISYTFDVAIIPGLYTIETQIIPQTPQ